MPHSRKSGSRTWFRCGIFPWMIQSLIPIIWNTLVFATSRQRRPTQWDPRGWIRVRGRLLMPACWSITTWSGWLTGGASCRRLRLIPVSGQKRCRMMWWKNRWLTWSLMKWVTRWDWCIIWQLLPLIPWIPCARQVSRKHTEPRLPSWITPAIITSLSRGIKGWDWHQRIWGFMTSLS